MPINVIYKALQERNSKKAHDEMVKHVKEVERDLIAIQKEKRAELNIRRLLKKKGFIRELNG